MPETEHESHYVTSGNTVPPEPAAHQPEIKPESVSNHRTGKSWLSFWMTNRLAVASLALGLIGGLAGSYGLMHYGASATPASRQQLVVQESSAVVDVARKVSPSVVSITSKSVAQGLFGRPVEQDGAGTGIIVTADGLIMTNNHVVSDDTANYTVITADGKELTSAKVIARDPLNDVAFVRVSASGLPVAEIGDSSSVQVGQEVVAIGNALGQFQNSVTEGVISGMGRPIVAGDSGSGANPENLSNLFQTDAAINPGNSGGPLLNLAGQVIGMNTAVAGQNAQNIGFAIPVNDIKAQLTSVEQQGKIVRPYLGVRYVALTQAVAQANNLKVSEGAWLSGSAQAPAIIDGSPAAKAGLKDGDVITKVAGDKVTVTNSLQALVGKHKVGDSIPLTVWRDGKEQTIKVTLEEAPAL